MRRAFTLIELLVTLAVIAVAVGLLIPAVQRVRESSNATRCRNNLKQFGLGVHQYHSACRELPSAGSVCWQRDGWLVQISPYVEQNRLLYNCPSRRGVTDLGPHPNGRWQSRVLTDYAGFVVEVDFWQGGDFMSPRRGASYSGAFRRLNAEPRGVDFPDLSRGSSQTVLVGEKVMDPAHYRGGLPNDDCGWQDGFDFDVMRSSAVPPARDAPDAEQFGFGSAHRSGLHLLYADGSVRFWNYTGDYALWSNLGRR